MFFSVAGNAIDSILDGLPKCIDILELLVGPLNDEILPKSANAVNESVDLNVELLIVFKFGSLSSVITFPSESTYCNDSGVFANAFCDGDCTGVKFIVSRLEHPLNAYFSMLCKFGKSIFLSPKFESNAYYVIVVMEFGKSTSHVKLANVYCPIVVVPSETMTSSKSV